MVPIADTKVTNEGKDQILNGGITGACKFALSKNTADEMEPTATLSSGKVPNEITGTGYAQTEETAPTSSSQKKAFAAQTWKTESATNWPSDVKSISLICNAKLICTWNLVTGGTARNLASASTTETFTPTVAL